MVQIGCLKYGECRPSSCIVRRLSPIHTLSLSLPLPFRGGGHCDALAVNSFGVTISSPRAQTSPRRRIGQSPQQRRDNGDMSESSLIYSDCRHAVSWSKACLIANCTRQHSYRTVDRAMRPIYGCPEKFSESSLRTRLFFQKFVMDFCSGRC